MRSEGLVDRVRRNDGGDFNRELRGVDVASETSSE